MMRQWEAEDMIDLKSILSIPQKKDDAQERLDAKIRRKEQATRRFRILSNEEREVLYTLIAQKFRYFEMHLSLSHLSKSDFINATDAFLGSYVFDLAIDITNQIRKEHTPSISFAVKEEPKDVQDKKYEKYRVYEEKRYAN